MARKMPVQKPGKSDSTVLTPPDFLKATKRFLGIKRFEIDLAASHDNAVADHYITEVEGSLSRDWVRFFKKNARDVNGWCWLNPPYAKIRPWVEKCDEASPSLRIALLVPAAIGANWWREHVYRVGKVYIVGRLNFLDRFHNPIVSPKTGLPTPYPKDLALVLYGNGSAEADYDYFDWKDEL